MSVGCLAHVCVVCVCAPGQFVRLVKRPYIYKSKVDCTACSTCDFELYFFFMYHRTHPKVVGYAVTAGDGYKWVVGGGNAHALPTVVMTGR